MINILIFITAHTLFHSPIFLRNTTLRFDFLSKHFWISNGLSRDGPAQNAIHALSLIQRRIRRRRQNPTCKFHHYYYVHSKLSYVISLWLDFLTKSRLHTHSNIQRFESEHSPDSHCRGCSRLFEWIHDIQDIKCLV